MVVPPLDVLKCAIQSVRAEPVEALHFLTIAARRKDGPSTTSGQTVLDKADLRKQLRAARRDHVAALPDGMRALVFHRPPTPLVDLISDGTTIGLYRAGPHEAPLGAYCRFFLERGHAIALPRFTSRNTPMAFARHSDPYEESDCEIGPFGLLQPTQEADAVEPEVVLVPLLGFTASGDRIGQGGGHYDRWLAEHPHAMAIGIGWDVQQVASLPVEAHDIPLRAIVTPTRLHGPF